jgi:hypothetical protein
MKRFSAKEAILKTVKFSMDGLVSEGIRSFNYVVGGGKSPTTAGKRIYLLDRNQEPVYRTPVAHACLLWYDIQTRTRAVEEK